MQPTEQTPNRITVADARALADKGEKAWVIIIAVAGDGTQFTTWGRTPEDKVAASDLSEHLGEYLCGGPGRTPPVVHESFKLDAAKNKARVEELEAAMLAFANIETTHPRDLEHWHDVAAWSLGQLIDLKRQAREALGKGG